MIKNDNPGPTLAAIIGLGGLSLAVLVWIWPRAMAWGLAIASVFGALLALWLFAASREIIDP